MAGTRVGPLPRRASATVNPKLDPGHRVRRGVFVADAQQRVPTAKFFTASRGAQLSVQILHWAAEPP